MILRLFPIYLLTHLVWAFLFAPGLKGTIPFWPLMSFAALGLTVFTLLACRTKLRELLLFKKEHLLWGILGAGALYAFFWLGHAASTRLLPFAQGEIQSIYTIKAGTSPFLIGGLLLFLIGPAEEIFWRGFLQSELAGRFGSRRGWLGAALLYAAVHIWAANVMLFLAALICGLFWGWMLHRTRSLWPGILSHALWDVTIFILFPIF